MVLNQKKISMPKTPSLTFKIQSIALLKALKYEQLHGFNANLTNEMLERFEHTCTL